MKKSYKVLLLFYILMIAVYFGKTTSLAKNSEDLNKKILEQTSGTVVEYGLRYELVSSSNGEATGAEIFYELPLERDTMDVKVINDSFQYSLEFKSDTTKGYVQYVKGEDEKIIVSLIDENGSTNIREHKSQIDNILRGKDSDVRCFDYIKANTQLENLSQTKEIVEAILRKSGASNINSISIDEGFSLTAYTGKGKPMKNGNDLIDINCAIRSYDSGIYVIIGTPVISTCY